MYEAFVTVIVQIAHALKEGFASNDPVCIDLPAVIVAKNAIDSTHVMGKDVSKSRDPKDGRRDKRYNLQAKKEKQRCKWVSTTCQSIALALYTSHTNTIVPPFCSLPRIRADT